MSAEDLAGRVTALADPLAASTGAEIVDVEVRGQRGSRIVRIVADSEEGLDVDAIAALSRTIGDALEAIDLIKGAYTLEVSSPGVDRPLRTPRDFRRHDGREIRVVRTREAIDRGDKGEVVGTLLNVADDAVTLVVDSDEVTVPLADVDHAKVVLPW